MWIDLPPSTSVTRSESVLGTNSDFGRSAASSRLVNEIFKKLHECFEAKYLYQITLLAYFQQVLAEFLCTEYDSPTVLRQSMPSVKSVRPKLQNKFLKSISSLTFILFFLHRSPASGTCPSERAAKIRKTFPRHT